MKKINSLKKRLQSSLDENILSKQILENPDRDILSIVLECYTNLNDSFLAGYSISVASQEAQFKMEWKEDLQKTEVISKSLLNSTDIMYMENAFYELKLRYIIRPDIIKDDYKISAIDNTIARFEDTVREYQFKNSTLIEELKRRREFYVNSPYIKTKFTADDEEGTMDLFIQEQSVIIPILHKTGKYKIDGYNYYGVYNDARGSLFTADGKFSFKLTRRGKSGTYFIKINKYKVDKKNEERLDAIHYGHVVNPFFVLSNGPVTGTPLQDIIPFTDNELFNKALVNTYNEALRLESIGEVPSSKIVQRLQKSETVFRDEYIEYIKEYANRLDENGHPIHQERKKEFIHLARLDEDIYNAINNERRKIHFKKLVPSDAVKRKNLSPMIIYTTIKQGYNTSDSKTPTQMFEASTTSPNPIDLFKLFQYIKISHHTETKKKPKSKANNGDLPIDIQLVKIGNMEYLGTFAPKNSSNMECSLIMHFDLGEDNIVYRNKNYEEVYIPELEVKDELFNPLNP